MASAVPERMADGPQDKQIMSEDPVVLYADLVADHAPGFATGDEELAAQSLEVARRLFDQSEYLFIYLDVHILRRNCP
jgi:hypothetical protein